MQSKLKALAAEFLHRLAELLTEGSTEVDVPEVEQQWVIEQSATDLPGPPDVTPTIAAIDPPKRRTRTACSLNVARTTSGFTAQIARSA